MPELRHTQSNPYPRGQGTSAVPVLFALQNVQPSIVSAAAVPEAASSGQTASTPSEPKSTTALGANAPSAEVASKSTPKPVGGKTSSNRLYNATIFGLIAVLFVLAIRNSSVKSKPSESTAANTTTATPLVPNGSSVASVPAPTNPPVSTTAPELPSAASAMPSTPEVPKLASNAPLMLTPADMRSPSAPTSETETTSGAGNSSQAPTSNANPTVPLLLSPANPNSSAPALTAPNFANEQQPPTSRPYGADSSDETLRGRNNVVESGQGRETVVERPMLDNSVGSDGNVATDANARPATNPLVVDSNNPELDVHSLYSILLKTRNGNQAANAMPNLAVAPANNSPRYSPVSVSSPQYSPYTPVSSGVAAPTGASNVADGMMLSGQAYPAQQKDLRPIPITAAPYENNAQAQARSMNVIMQPNGSNPNVQWNSNRYQGGTITVPPAADVNGNTIQQPVYQPTGTAGNRALESEMPPIRPYAPIGTNIVPPANAGNQNVLYPQQSSR